VKLPLKSHISDLLAPYEVAQESYAMFRQAGCNHLQACAWLGSEDGETSFRIGVVGDHGEAFGPAQHHQARIDAIKKGTGIDMRSASHAEQIKGIIWEMTKGGYRHVWPALVSSTTMQEAVTVLVRKYEQSANQLRDISRRTNLGNYWLDRMPDE
jgi:hypothetical protein